MLWLKAFHIIFVVTWFAGLFYLPRLFVYHAGSHDASSYARFVTMERRLLRIMTLGAALAVGCGLALWIGWWRGAPAHWLHLKASLGVALLCYHAWLYTLYRDFRDFRNVRPARFFRWINEVPTLFLVAMVILAVVKPF